MELVEIGRLLNDAGVRLLTLTGPGGVGKTRLALQAAVEHLDVFADGIFFVPLAALHSADLLVGAIANALRLEVEAAPDPKSHLLAQLGNKEMLLVLDNFEHLLTAPDLSIGTEAPVEQAGRLWGATEVLRQALGVPLPPSKRAEYEPYLTAARDRAEPATWEAALAEGRSLTLAKAIDEARAASNSHS